MQSDCIEILHINATKIHVEFHHKLHNKHEQFILQQVNNMKVI